MFIILPSIIWCVNVIIMFNILNERKRKRESSVYSLYIYMYLYYI